MIFLHFQQLSNASFRTPFRFLIIFFKGETDISHNEGDFFAIFTHSVLVLLARRGEAAGDEAWAHGGSGKVGGDQAEELHI